MNARRLPTRTGGPRRCDSFQMVAHARERTVETPRGRPPECRQADGRPIRRSRSSARRQGRRSTRPPPIQSRTPRTSHWPQAPHPRPRPRREMALWEDRSAPRPIAPPSEPRNHAKNFEGIRGADSNDPPRAPQPGPDAITATAPAHRASRPSSATGANHETGRVVHGGKDV